MYPFLRLAYALWSVRNAPPMALTDAHVSQHICWPWDLDPWNELNNGRTLTIYDLGRIPMGRRVGLDKVLRANGWGLTVAGNSTRYRRRVQAFDRLTMRTACVGWDARFIYIDQSLWKAGECTSQILVRSAFTSKAGILPPARVLAAMGQPETSPPLPPWVQAWVDADSTRPWPPAAPSGS